MMNNMNAKPENFLPHFSINSHLYFIFLCKAREAYYNGKPLIVDDMFDRVEVMYFNFFNVLRQSDGVCTFHLHL